VERQKQFADKHNLNYTLLADTEDKVREAYGVGGTALLGLAARQSCTIVKFIVPLS
jgi:peroxiredoxin